MKKKARWIRRTHLFGGDKYECSQCGCVSDKPQGTCPGCGARMGGSGYDPSWVDEIEAIDAFLDD